MSPIFPFVHENILGTQERPEIPDYDVITDENGVTATDIRIFQPNPDGSHIPNWVTYTYKAHRPLVAYFRKEAEEKFAILLMVTPIEEVKSLMWMWMVMTQDDSTDESLRAFQDEIADAGPAHRAIAAARAAAARLAGGAAPAQRQDGDRLSPLAERTGLELRDELIRAAQPGSDAIRTSI